MIFVNFSALLNSSLVALCSYWTVKSSKCGFRFFVYCVLLRYWYMFAFVVLHLVCPVPCLVIALEKMSHCCVEQDVKPFLRHILLLLTLPVP